MPPKIARSSNSQGSLNNCLNVDDIGIAAVLIESATEQAWGCDRPRQVGLFRNS
jgi:hypothetical protein